jgi:hypothetical protein
VFRARSHVREPFSRHYSLSLSLSSGKNSPAHSALASFSSVSFVYANLRRISTRRNDPEEEREGERGGEIYGRSPRAIAALRDYRSPREGCWLFEGAGPQSRKRFIYISPVAVSSGLQGTRRGQREIIRVFVTRLSLLVRPPRAEGWRRQGEKALSQITTP